MKRLLFLSSIIVYGLLCGILFGRSYASAQVGGYVSTPNYWKKVGSEIMPITSSNTLSVPKFKLSATTTEGYVLTASSTDGTVKWAPASGGGGTISGNSTSGYVTFWSATSTIAGDGSLFWDNTNKFLGIGTSTPTGILTIGAATSTIYTDLLINPLEKNAGNLIDAQVGGVSKFSVTNTGSLTAVAVSASSGFFGTAATLNANYLRNGVSNSRTGDGYLLAITGAAARTNTSGNQQFFAILPSYNQASGTAANTDLFINRTETAVGSGDQLLIDAQVGGSSKFSINTTGIGTFGSSVVSGATVRAGATSYFGFSTSRSRLYSSANGLIELTNSTISDFTRLNFGTVTSGYPALSVVSTSSATLPALRVMAADGTSNANLLVTNNIGVGTTTPLYDVSVENTASTTIGVGANGKSGCIILGNSDNSAGLNYITALNGVLTATTTKPINCR